MKRSKRQRKKSLKAVDFFCCSGGVTCGFRMAGIKVLAGIDIDGTFKETYENNNKGSKFIEADIAQYKPEELANALGIAPNMDDMIFIACSPCQYYTKLHTDKTKSSKGKLLLEEFRRFVNYFKPGFLFIENVKGLETKSGSPLSEFKKDLQALGYVFDDEIVNASSYRVPQNRMRYVLVASRINNFIKVPSASKNGPVTVRETISKMRPIPAGYRDKKVAKHWTGKLEPINLQRIQKTPHNGGTRLSWKDDKTLQLECYKGNDHTFKDVYGRIFWDFPAPTITTKFYSLSNGRFGHPEQDRALSLREGALLQSFPSNYRFYSDSMVVVARMIGNAVPPKLARAIAKGFIKSYKNAAIRNKSSGS